ncbi:MAG: fibronectin type III domain-containing protein [Ignavibacteria bacterium]
MNNLSAAKGDSKGEIHLQWDSKENAVSYIIEIAKTFNSNNANNAKEIRWKVLDIISNSRYTVRNLRSNKEYYFRVAFVNVDGNKEQSRKVAKKAP